MTIDFGIGAIGLILGGVALIWLISALSGRDSSRDGGGFFGDLFGGDGDGDGD